MKLYHGTTTERIACPDLLLCRNTTDFGKGFYTTTNFAQATRWALLKQQRLRTPHAFVLEYAIDDAVLQSQEYTVRRFDGATKEWLDFVVTNRKGGAPAKRYDFIMSPVANDKLYTTLLLYEQGILTVEATIDQLQTHTLFDQLSFHTAKAIQTMAWMQSVTLTTYGKDQKEEKTRICL